MGGLLDHGPLSQIGRIQWHPHMELIDGMELTS